MSISEYLASMRQGIEILDDYGFAESIIYQEELRAGKQAIVNIEVVLVDGSRLIIREYIGSKYGLERLSYAYQYQDNEGNLIFRYDNAAHKPKISSRNHRHHENGEITIADPPEIQTLIDEVVRYL